jgi:hypothetical protein
MWLSASTADPERHRFVARHAHVDSWLEWAWDDAITQVLGDLATLMP